MTQQKELWKIATLQAEQVAKIKDAKTKASQIVLLCKTLKAALKGGA